jgi:hypothetical protein
VLGFAAVACGTSGSAAPLASDAATDDAGALGDADTSDGGTADASDGGTADAAAGDSLPAGAISFFNKTACPLGWLAYGALAGRVALPVAPGMGVGKTAGTPFTGTEDRMHAHAGDLTGTVTLSDVSYAGIAGGGNSGVAASGDAPTKVTIDPARSNLPYVQLFVCQKTSPAKSGAAPVPTGLLVFFEGDACPVGWAPAQATGGRHLVGLPDGGAVGATFGGAPLSSAELRSHTHSASGKLTTTPHGIALASGAGASGYAKDGTYDYSATTSTGAADMPYLQLLQCRKD